MLTNYDFVKMNTDERLRNLRCEAEIARIQRHSFKNALSSSVARFLPSFRTRVEVVEPILSNICDLS